jgi:type IV fimbrial biogenesis protein FimT
MTKVSGQVTAASGLTLIEALVTLAIASTLMALAAPSFSRMGESSQLRVLNNDLLDHLRLARSEAIVRGTRVVICAAKSASECSSATGWQQGWLVFADLNNNGKRDVDELLIRYRPAAPDGWSMKGNSTVTRYVSYDAMGSTRMISGAFQAGTVTICRSGSSSSAPRQVIINSLGRVRSQDAPTAVCS